jgi:hypothetical protein
MRNPKLRSENRTRTSGSVRIETHRDFALALERLRRRDPEALAAFILSLAQESGPVGEQVRTFIVGDDVAETVKSVSERIKGLEIPTEYEHRHARGREMGASLEFIVASIESLVLPVSPKVAFELLVALFEADGVAMENCGEHDWEVECAFQRAAVVMAEAAKSLPAADVAEKIRALVAVDSYGVRERLRMVVSMAGVD